MSLYDGRCLFGEVIFKAFCTQPKKKSHIFEATKLNKLVRFDSFLLVVFFFSVVCVSL